MDVRCLLSWAGWWCGSVVGGGIFGVCSGGGCWGGCMGGTVFNQILYIRFSIQVCSSTIQYQGNTENKVNTMKSGAKSNTDLEALGCLHNS